jgi:FixJ family two-component response regulator
VIAKVIFRKIYVVDDDPSVRRALKRLFTSAATEAETFASAEEFLKKFNSNQPACLVLDIYLSGMTGIELYHQLLKSGQRIPVVFVTAQDTEALREEVKELSGGNLLRKPFTQQSMLSAIQEAITISEKSA